MSHYIELPDAASPCWKDPVANFASLPTGHLTGEVRVTLDTSNAYQWNGSSWNLAWAAGSVGGPGVAVDGQIVLFNGASGNLVKAATTSGFVKAVSGVYGTQASISLTADVSGVLPIANGGTNSSTALTNGLAMVSAGGKIVESAVTSTELGYVSGVTSAIQTQFSGKEPSITSGTTAQYWRGDKSFQTLNTAALGIVTDGSAAATSKIGEILTASQATNTTTGVGATGVFGNAISLSLTAGSWLVWGTAGFNENGATLTTGVQVGISASSSGSGISEFDTCLAPYQISGSSDALLSTPPVMIDISSTTTYYLNTKFWYTAGTPKHRGRIQARRVR